MCKPTISEPFVYRVYVQSAITFHLACLTCANWPFQNHCIQGICSDCNNILFGLFAMCKPMISEPLVYRLYVWCAITFYLACLTCVNQWFLNHWYIGYMFGVKSHFIWHVWDVQTDYFWPRAVSYTPPHILMKSWYSGWTPDKIQIDLMTSMWTLHQDSIRESQDFVETIFTGL